jgi:hypothetical protein
MWIVYKIVDKLEDKTVWVGTARNIERAGAIHFSESSQKRKDKFTADNSEGRYLIEKIDEFESRILALIHKDTWELRFGLNKRYRKIDFKTMIALNNANWLVSLTPMEREVFKATQNKGKVKIPCIVCGKPVMKKALPSHLGNQDCIKTYIKIKEDGE